jgi:hypothetical protein
MGTRCGKYEELGCRRVHDPYVEKSTQPRLPPAHLVCWILSEFKLKLMASLQTVLSSCLLCIFLLAGLCMFQKLVTRMYSNPKSSRPLREPRFRSVLDVRTRSRLTNTNRTREIGGGCEATIGCCKLGMGTGKEPEVGR